MKICAVDGCERSGKITRGWCSKHYHRWLVHGNPLTVLPRGATAGLPGTENLHWVGDNVSYKGQHHRVKAAKGKASDHPCVDCGDPAAHWSYSHGCPDERTDLQRNSLLPFCHHLECFEPRCHFCHTAYDKHAA